MKQIKILLPISEVILPIKLTTLEDKSFRDFEQMFSDWEYINFYEVEQSQLKTISKKYKSGEELSYDDFMNEVIEQAKVIVTENKSQEWYELYIKTDNDDIYRFDFSADVVDFIDNLIEYQ